METAPLSIALGLGIIGLAVSIGIGLILLLSGVAKFRHRMLLEGVVANYRILPRPLVAPVAFALPYIETAVGGLLIAGLRPLPQIIAIVLLLAFAAGMAINVRRGRGHIDCGCGLSSLRQPLGWPLVARNLCIAALLLLALPVSPPVSGGAIAAAAAGGLALFLCYLVFNAIDALSRSSKAAYRR